MALYQNATVADAKLEVGNYAMYVGAEGTTAAGTWVNLGAGMLNSIAYVPVDYDVQAGNAPDPINGVTSETMTLGFDLIEYDGSSFSNLSGGAMAGTSGSLTIGGQITVKTAKGIKLVNIRKLASGSSQTTTWVFNRCFLQNGWTAAVKSDNDTDPLTVYSFQVEAKQYATAQTIATKTVA